MSNTPSSPKKTPADPSRRREGRAPGETTLEWELRILDELTEMGLDMARALERRVRAQAARGEPLSAPGGEDVGLAFERLAREICQGVLLSAKLEERMRPRAAPPNRRPAPALAPDAPGTKTTVH
jgi:hypothetical protein